MIEYQAESWLRTTLAFRGAVLPQVLGRVGLLTGFCLLLCLLDDYVFERYAYPLPSLDQLGHTVLGVAMSMLIVFRTNSSNNRYWDGRTFWGALVNGSRNLARMASRFSPPADDLARLISAYAIAVRETLRGTFETRCIASLVPGRLASRAATASNPPSILAAAISDWINERRIDGRIDGFQALAMEQTLNAMVDAQGGCERIQKTPLPFVYVTLIRQLLLIYLASLPFVLVGRMGYAAPLVVAVVSFGMLGIEEAGAEIERPFGVDPNCLPLEQICTTIARDAALLCSSTENAGSPVGS
ncbi:MAG TPA: bestrophin family ion channel [Pirellulales bacterium]|nr:bestrophin family ion channel [Pirellulales bacterium]